MNDDVRAAFRAQAGWDPIEIWNQRNDAASLRQFLDFRAGLVRQHAGGMARGGREVPRVPPRPRHRSDSCGRPIRYRHERRHRRRCRPRSAAARYPRVLVSDRRPGHTSGIWGRSAIRKLRRRYAALTPHRDKLAIDINIVDRYQDVYPTKQQTGTELFELVHTAAAAFPRVALYFENSILKPDLPLLAAASLPR